MMLVILKATDMWARPLLHTNSDSNLFQARFLLARNLFGRS